VLWQDTSVSEVYAASIFRVKLEAATLHSFTVMSYSDFDLFFDCYAVPFIVGLCVQNIGILFQVQVKVFWVVMLCSVEVCYIPQRSTASQLGRPQLLHCHENLKLENLSQVFTVDIIYYFKHLSVLCFISCSFP